MKVFIEQILYMEALSCHREKGNGKPHSFDFFLATLLFQKQIQNCDVIYKTFLIS